MATNMMNTNPTSTAGSGARSPNATPTTTSTAACTTSVTTSRSTRPAMMASRFTGVTRNRSITPDRQSEMMANQLERFARAHRQVSAADDRNARVRRRLAWRFEEDGSLSGTFRLPPLQGAVLLKALRAACADLAGLPPGAPASVSAETPATMQTPAAGETPAAGDTSAAADALAADAAAAAGPPAASAPV